jgi:hypothetical protein
MLDRSSGILSTNTQFGEAVEMDLLSEVLRVVKLGGAVLQLQVSHFLVSQLIPVKVFKCLSRRSRLAGREVRVSPSIAPE